MQALVRDQLAAAEATGHLVIGLEFERSISGSHEHVAGVWTSGDRYVTRADVLRSLAGGEAWWSLEDGQRSPLRRVTHCPWPGCSLIPYLHVAGASPEALERRR